MKSKRNIDDWSDISNRVEYLRVTLEYSISSFAKKTGCTLETITKIIEGKAPSFPYLSTLAKLFPVREPWLMSGEGEPWFSSVDLNKYKYKESIGLNKAMKYGDDERFARFKEVRLNKSLSQVLFADKLETSRDTMASIENGRQEIPTYLLEMLHKKLNVDLNWLVAGSGDNWRYSEEPSKSEVDAREMELLKELENIRGKKK